MELMGFLVTRRQHISVNANLDLCDARNDIHASQPRWESVGSFSVSCRDFHRHGAFWPRVKQKLEENLTALSPDGTERMTNGCEKKKKKHH